MVSLVGTTLGSTAPAGASSSAPAVTRVAGSVGPVGSARAVTPVSTVRPVAGPVAVRRATQVHQRRDTAGIRVVPDGRLVTSECRPGSCTVVRRLGTGDRPGTRTWPGTGGRTPVTSLRLMNYQPSTHGWPLMWTDFRPAELSADFARIRAANANAVRLAVIPDTFGWPTPSATMMDRLRTAVDLADRHGLSVQLTLFDWWDRYWQHEESLVWAAAVLRPFRGDPRIALVEVRNEVNPYDPAVISWLKVVTPQVRSSAPGVPVTASISTTRGTAALSRLLAELGTGGLDVADIHYYGTAAGARRWLAAARAAAGDLPLVIGEAGYSISNEVDAARPVAHREELQADWYDAVFRAAGATGVRVVAPWTLNDFSATAIPGLTPDRAPEEYAFGLVRADGSRRPAFGVVRAWWTGPPVAGLVADFDDPADRGLPAGWTVSFQGGARVATDSAVRRSVPQSVALGATGGTVSGVPCISRYVTNALSPGQKWTGTAWVRTRDSAGTARISLSWFDADGRYLGQAESARAPGTTSGWVRLTVNGSAPNGAEVLRAYQVGNDPGTVWFDDVTVRPSG